MYCMVTIVNNGGEPYEYDALYFEMFDGERSPYYSYGSSSQPELVHAFCCQRHNQGRCLICSARVAGEGLQHSFSGGLWALPSR